MDIDANPPAMAQVSFTWPGGRGAITLTADGLSIDTAAELVAAGLEASTSPVYVVTRSRVNERTTKDRERPAKGK